MSDIEQRVLGQVRQISELPDVHIARHYLVTRRIPPDQWSLFWYAPDFSKIADLTEKYRGRVLASPRLAIPIRNRSGELVAVTGRALDWRASIRYVSIQLIDEKTRLIFGLERNDSNRLTYVTEGAIDSLFLPNAVGVGSSYLGAVWPDIGIEKDRLVLVPDIQPRNPEIVTQTHRIVREGFSVALLPDTLPGKDINELVLAGMIPSEILSLISDYTFRGIRAEVEFDAWARIKKKSHPQRG
jgi:hypothetical protein